MIAPLRSASHICCMALRLGLSGYILTSCIVGWYRWLLNDVALYIGCLSIFVEQLDSPLHTLFERHFGSIGIDGDEQVCGVHRYLGAFIVADSGAFKVKSFTPTNTKTPALELMRCEKCGEFFAVAEEVIGGKYCSYTKDGANLFDLSSKKNQILLFALTDKDKIEDGNQLFEVNGDVLTPTTKQIGYNLIANIHMQCPHCDADLSTKKRVDSK